MPEAMPEPMPEPVPEPMPDPMPEPVPDPMPDQMPESMPEPRQPHEPREPYGRSEPHDSLRAAFRNAAAAGQRAATPVPAARITARGTARRRTRIALAAAAMCLALAGGAVAAASVVLPRQSGPASPPVRSVTVSPRQSSATATTSWSPPETASPTDAFTTFPPSRTTTPPTNPATSHR